jgi:NitT/TauT family transport system substrate-binding protein
MPKPRLTCRLLAALVAAALFAATEALADTVRLAVQKTGTVSWELDVIRRHGLDKQAGLTIEAVELASPEAGKIALRGGAADVIVTDWLWVSRERSLGATLAFYPFSTTVGAIMVPAASPIKSLADLRRKKLAVAGGPIDKSWLFVQAAAKQSGIDLPREATIVYGSPALLAEKTLQGEMDANLNFWNFCARLEAKGFRRLVGVEELLPRLGARGRSALIGYVFSEQWADKNSTAIEKFIAVTRRAKEILASSVDEWQRIARLVGAEDGESLKIYRDRYREGVPQRPIDEEEADARNLFRLLAELGGASLVGPARELEPGTFYRPRSGG